jgi:hypothetical protein
MSTSPDFPAELTKAWRLLTSPLRRLPDFILPGAPKCGTSSLYDAILLHPGTRRASRKEPTNFIHYPTSELRCRMHFPFRPGTFLTGEASVEYFIHPEAPARIRAILPDVKLIFLFRDPVKRAWSDYQMFRKSGHEKETFDTVVLRSMGWLSDPSLDPLVQAAARQSFSPVRYLLNGMYHRIIQNWLAVFPRESCLFLIGEDFYRDGPGVTARAWEFLGLPPVAFPSTPHAREGGYSETMLPETFRQLSAFFEPQNRALEEFLGCKLPWSSP